MVAPIVPSSLYQQAIFDTMKAANKAAQQPSYGPDFDPREVIAPLVAPYIFDPNSGRDEFLI